MIRQRHGLREMLSPHGLFSFYWREPLRGSRMTSLSQRITVENEQTLKDELRSLCDRGIEGLILTFPFDRMLYWKHIDGVYKHLVEQAESRSSSETEQA
jgi:hypothetical protein